MPGTEMHKTFYKVWGTARSCGVDKLKYYQLAALEKYGVIQKGRVLPRPDKYMDIIEFQLLNQIRSRDGLAKGDFYLAQDLLSYSTFHRRFNSLVSRGFIKGRGKGKSTRGPKPDIYGVSAEGLKALTEWSRTYLKLLRAAGEV